MRQVSVYDIDRRAPQKHIHAVHIMQPGPWMEVGVEPEAFEQRDACLTGEVFDLTPRGGTEDDLLPPTE
jgi:hypothetical protein